MDPSTAPETTDRGPRGVSSGMEEPRSVNRIHRIVLSAFAALALLPAGAQAASLGCADDASGAEDVAFTQAILDGTNLHRTQMGLAALQLDPVLSKAATWKARDLARRDYFSHDDPASGAAPGRDPWTRLDDCGYSADGETKAENIAAGQRSGAAFVTAWLNSPGHRENIETPAMRYVGIATARSDSSAYGTYSVQIFSSKPSATRSLDSLGGGATTTTTPAATTSRTRTTLRRTSSVATRVAGCVCWSLDVSARLQRADGRAVAGRRVVFQRITSRGARVVLGSAVTNSAGVARLRRTVRPASGVHDLSIARAWFTRSYRSTRAAYGGSPTFTPSASFAAVRAAG